MRSVAGIEERGGLTDAAKRAGIRVMLVDDSLTARTAFARMIEQEPDMETVATAASAEIAIANLAHTPVDVILLDLEMPGMGGLQALPKLIERAAGAQILVVSALTPAGAEHTLAALSMGAAETMLKPLPGHFDDAYRTSLVAKIRALSGTEARSSSITARTVPSRRSVGSRPQIVAIGASTGGIHALGQYLQALPRGFDIPILVTQHLPDAFMSVFARQLEAASGRQALVARAGLAINRRTIVVAPGDSHLVVRGRGGQFICDLDTRPAASGCMPSVDPMLTSLAEASEGAALAVVLSGMGRDGASGARALVDAGGTVFAQDAISSAVWGMPRAVIEAGLAAEVGSPDDLAAKTIQLAGVASWT